MDNRNIIDHYKYWREEAIKADLDNKRNNFSVACLNFGNDFNIGSVIRNANAFLAQTVYIIGRHKWDRRGAVGVQNYTNFKYVKDAKELHEVIDKSWFVVGVDNIHNATPIEDMAWPKDRHVLMVFGQEDVGIHGDVVGLIEWFVYIKQYGSVRSLNVACASAIAMHDYCRKNITLL